MFYLFQTLCLTRSRPREYVDKLENQYLVVIFPKHFLLRNPE